MDSINEAGRVDSQCSGEVRAETPPHPASPSSAVNWISQGARHHMNEQTNEARGQGFGILNSREMSRIKRRRELED